MDRRNFLKTGLALTPFVAGVLPARAATQALPPFRPDPAHGWREFELVSEITLANPGPAKVWIPLPSLNEPDWVVPLDNRWEGNADEMTVVSDASGRAKMLFARWAEGSRTPQLSVTSAVRLRDRATDLSAPREVVPLSAEARALHTAATERFPTDGIVGDTAAGIVKGVSGDLAQARAIYDWVVDNTFRNPATRGCGLGDIVTMLETGDLSGKCADLNALYVGLARAAGLPARDVYGLRVADSRFGYKSLGKTGDVSKGQHCRAEVWLTGFGWVGVDPADVRKVMLEEPPGNLARDDHKVQAVEQALFGGWEGNWLAYNDGHGVRLPGSDAAELPYLMYPQGETTEGRLDSLDPKAFGYRLTSRERTAAGA